MDGKPSGTTIRGWWQPEIKITPGKARHRGVIITSVREGKPKRLYQEVLTGHVGKVSWGEPAMVAEASCDKRCPSCSTDKRDGFQIEFDGANCSAIYCPKCGFTFGKDVTVPDGRRKLMFGPQCDGKEIAAIARDRARKRTKCNG
jgi:hypothetical protein